MSHKVPQLSPVRSPVFLWIWWIFLTHAANSPLLTAPQQLIHAENKHGDAFIPHFPIPSHPVIQGLGRTLFSADNCFEPWATAGVSASRNLTLRSSPLGSYNFTSHLQTSHRDYLRSVCLLNFIFPLSRVTHGFHNFPSAGTIRPYS